MTYVSVANARETEARTMVERGCATGRGRKERGGRGRENERVEKGASRGKREGKEPGGCLESSQNDSQPPVIYIRLRG